MMRPNAPGRPSGWRRSWPRKASTIDARGEGALWSALTSLASAPSSSARSPASRSCCSQRPEAGAAALLRRRSVRATARCRGRTSRRRHAVQAFETEGLIGAGAAPAVLTYLFHRIESRLDGRPTLLIIDEGWLVLDDRSLRPAAARMAEDAAQEERLGRVRHPVAVRHRPAAIAPAIVESCPTRVFLPNERAIEPQITAIYRRFGLNDRQIEILARATPKRDYYCQSRRGNRLFELGLGPVALALCAASSKADQAAIERILAEHGRDGFPCRVARRSRCRLGRRPHFRPDRPGGVMIIVRSKEQYAGENTQPSRCRSLCSFTAARQHQCQRRRSCMTRPTTAQNVLTATRALQQVNNQITSLTNQTQMLLNQAKNLANLPIRRCSSSVLGAANPAAAEPGAAHRL